MAVCFPQDLSPRVAAILDALSAMAAGERTLRIPLGQEGDELDAIAYGINILADELTFALDRLASERELAEEANRSKSAFLAYMSHEIRTPLNAISGFTELLSAEPFTPPQRDDFLRRIQNNCGALLRLVDEVLDLSKVESGELTFEWTDLPLRPWLGETIKSLEAQAKLKGLSLLVSVDDVVPALVRTDPMRLWQVVSNLIGNATKFSSGGSIRLHIGCLGNTHLAVDVEDDGMGITPERQPHLFHRFSQGDLSITRRFGGSGLGLALSRAICRAMGGELELIRSEPARGSWFRATFHVQAVSGETVLDERKHTMPSDKPLLGVRLLLVDDSEDSRVLFQAILGDAGADVVACASGKEAIDVPLQDIDIVLMDMQMPQMDGIQTAQQLQAKRNALPVIALTAHAMQGERERVLALGFTDYLTKPVDTRLLIERILAHG